MHEANTGEEESGPGSMGKKREKERRPATQKRGASSKNQRRKQDGKSRGTGNGWQGRQRRKRKSKKNIEHTQESGHKQGSARQDGGGGHKEKREGQGGEESGKMKRIIIQMANMADTMCRLEELTTKQDNKNYK
ncbi:hypothetical protein HNY73_015218 [Argiope bruennichi]|uniref:Uncharacterized protein n=1 Tax=Argiope bruennichi TaxID=94029 RepID=A0A8T0ETB7_ARGBR|nr:hypothetical protein HNY73_015218 [Argiope bruennichi]